MEPEPLKKKPGARAGDPWEKHQEPEPLEKKSEARAGATKKLAGSPALVTRHNLTRQNVTEPYRTAHIATSYYIII